LPFKPHDQTSNQRLIYEQMIRPENRDMFIKTVKEGKDEGWEVILDRIVRLVPPMISCSHIYSLSLAVTLYTKTLSSFNYCFSYDAKVHDMTRAYY
jgi:hypothetical protein